MTIQGIEPKKGTTEIRDFSYSSATKFTVCEISLIAYKTSLWWRNYVFLGGGESRKLFKI